jgi:hypothetical protein
MKQIVAWVNKHEQINLEKLNSKYNLNFTFVSSYEEFIKAIINNNSIPFLLRRKANTHFKKLSDLLVKYSNRIFYAYVERNAPCTLPKEFCWATENKNVRICDETNIMKLFQSL